MTGPTGKTVNISDLLEPTRDAIAPSPVKVLRKRRRYRKRRERPGVKSLKNSMPYTAHSLARSFRRARRDKKLTMGQLAERVGVAVATVSRIENAHVEDPRMSTLSAFADALEITIDKLIGRSMSDGL